MASADDFKFHEFDEASDLLAADPNATTKSLGEESRPQHATLLVGGDSEEEEGESDQTELLASQKKTSSFWTFQYYQDFFDIDTYQVLDRVRGSILPIPGKNFVRNHLRNNPDLYGPFWICATLVITVTIMGNLGTYMRLHDQKGYKYSPEFHKLSVAGVTIYSYAWAVPLGLWGFLQWRKGVSPEVGSYSFMETVCLYGYSLSAYIPATVLCVVPFEIFRWILILVATGLSSLVLVLAFWPHIRRDNKVVVISLVAVMVALHVLLAVGCKVYFFRQPEISDPVVPVANTTAQKIIQVTN
ncbi:Yip1 domain family member 2 S homeolog [Xenopus laevis]|uniref:Protein YIPF n=1 Tax=Xenopus laevis TaxID=8355 RepID=Q5XH44_XENLA|nr:Yip1 domain family member 2 S homeolog [Xenopus laevis]AAH84230.1 LOC495067 protein [Xenopus laevis]